MTLRRPGFAVAVLVLAVACDGNVSCPAGMFSSDSYPPCRMCPGDVSLPFHEAVDGTDLTNCTGSPALADILLLPGAWRASPNTSVVYKCIVAESDGYSPCKGGSDFGDYCAAGHDGPLCELCEDPGMYMDDKSGRCRDCPSLAFVFLQLGLILLAIGAVVAIAAFTPRRVGGGQRLGWVSAVARYFVLAVRGLVIRSQQCGLLAKVKAVFALFQVLAVLPRTYEMRVHIATGFHRIFDWTEIVGLELLMPGPCWGSYRQWLIAASTWPLVTISAYALLRIAFAVCHEWRRQERLLAPTSEPEREASVAYTDHDPAESGARRRSLWQSPPQAMRTASRRDTARALAFAAGNGLTVSLPMVLLVLFLSTISVSSRVYRTWHCTKFVTDDDGGYLPYNVDDLSLRCSEDDAEYVATSQVAVGLAVIWTGLVPLFYLALLCGSRRAIQRRRPTLLSRSTSFLWTDYHSNYWWWELAETLRRLAVTSYILVVGARQAGFAQIRALAALFISTTFLMLQLMIRPYKRQVDDVLNGLFSLVLIVWFNATIVINGCLISPAFCSAFGHKAGETPDELFSVFVSFLAVIVLASLVLICYITATATDGMVVLKERGTNAEPPLTLRRRHSWHVFLSHIWASGQDQVAVLKRQLQLVLPGIEVFLDVDDLHDIGALEQYVSESAVVLIFLSRGYFGSRNCMREVRAMCEMQKPVILLHEADESKGGLPFQQAVDECPSEYRPCLFDGRAPIPWTRIKEFQRFTLLLVAEQILAHSPHYMLTEKAAKREVSRLHGAIASVRVYFPDMEEVKDLVLRRHVTLYASRANPGALAAANELRDGGLSSHHHGHQHDPARQGGGTSTLRVTEEPLDWDSTVAEERANARRMQKGSSSCFVLYLSKQTFLGEAGDILAAEVRAARRAGASLLLLHENDGERGSAPFVHFFSSTPSDLVDDGIYKQLAVAMLPGRHRDVSLVLALKSLGASRAETRRLSLSAIRNSAQYAVEMVSCATKSWRAPSKGGGRGVKDSGIHLESGTGEIMNLDT